MKGKTVVRTEMFELETVALRKRQEAELEVTEMKCNHLNKFKYIQFKYIKYVHLHTLHCLHCILYQLDSIFHSFFIV